MSPTDPATEPQEPVARHPGIAQRMYEDRMSTVIPGDFTILSDEEARMFDHGSDADAAQ